MILIFFFNPDSLFYFIGGGGSLKKGESFENCLKISNAAFSYRVDLDHIFLEGQTQNSASKYKQQIILDNMEFQWVFYQIHISNSLNLTWCL